MKPNFPISTTACFHQSDHLSSKNKPLVQRQFETLPYAIQSLNLVFPTCLISFLPRKVLMALASFVFKLLIYYSLWFLFSCWEGITMDRSRTALTTNLWVMSFLNLLIAKEKLRAVYTPRCLVNVHVMKPRLNSLLFSKVHLPVTHLWHIPQRMFQLHILASYVSFLISRLLSTPNYLNSQFTHVSSHPCSRSLLSTNLSLCICVEFLTQTPNTHC